MVADFHNPVRAGNTVTETVPNGISAGIVGEGVNIGCQVGTLTLVEEGCAGVGIVSGVAVNEGLTAVDSAIGAS